MSHRDMIRVASHTATPLGVAKWLGNESREKRACRQVGDKGIQDVWPIPIAYLTAGLLVVCLCIPAI